jgi:hypothetical protein
MTWYDIAYGDTVRTRHDAVRAENDVIDAIDAGHDARAIVVTTWHRGKVYETCSGHDFLGGE